eukprot:12254322-Alexandrium_andersonii.AAC.1
MSQTASSHRAGPPLQEGLQREDSRPHAEHHLPAPTWWGGTVCGALPAGGHQPHLHQSEGSSE